MTSLQQFTWHNIPVGVNLQ